ncbi:hypothetical protein DICVIV_05518 [Dictyocaulus viviparus]|uniref:Indoleamine 2,3-dioxygenase n=1 Tax=Dictyocaulus viviparus TaxID=29172 RepID=A0A0D8XUW8_DICVI|nr:hypothetical protein DICVIV_05518 [Dictyocaulus viviparus]
MTRDAVEEILTRFRVSKDYGFLICCDPSTLPKYYRPWIDLCDNMIELIKENRVREAIECLPELKTDSLVTYEDWRIAHLLLVTLTSGYIWSNDPDHAPLILPRNLCTPLMAVSERLGMRPVICHASACLANWNLIDPTLPFSPDNLQLNAFKFLNSRANHWFFSVTAQVEKDFVPCICNIIRAVFFSMRNDFQHTKMALNSIVECLTQATKTMKV